MNQEDAVAAGAFCRLCPLRKEKNPDQIVVPSERNTSTLRLVVVGEGPSDNEEKLQKPFAGRAGGLLSASLTKIGVEKNSVYFANAILCKAEKEKDREVARVCCAPRLMGELRQLPEAPIVTLGKAPMKSVLGSAKLMYGRGFIWHATEIDPKHVGEVARSASKSKRVDAIAKAKALEGRAYLFGQTVLPLLSPAFVLKATAWSAIWNLDWARVGRVLEKEIHLEDACDYTVGDLAGLSLLDPSLVSLDIETNGVKPLECKILCVGLSDGGSTHVIYPWRNEYAKGLSAFLRQCGGVWMHNGYQFDQIALQARGVSLEGVSCEDTLLAHHAFLSHYPQRLDQVVSEYADSAPWKIKHGRRGQEEKGQLPVDMSPDEMCKYNAADCVLTALCAQRMLRDPAFQKERGVYEHDKELALICQQMTVAGIGVDWSYKDRLSFLLKARRKFYAQEMRALLENPAFSPRKLGEVREILFNRFKAKYAKLTETGLPSTSNATLEVIRESAAGTPAATFAASLLNFRLIDKVRSTYVGGTREHPLDFDKQAFNLGTGRAHFNWKPFTETGRLKGRFQSVPRYKRASKGGHPEDWVRKMYFAPPGFALLYYDLAQAEMFGAAYLSNDAAFMAACDLNIHTENAKVIFPAQAALGYFDGKEATEGLGNPFRQVSKNFGFAISYYAEWDTVYANLIQNGFTNVTPAQVQSQLNRLRRAYRFYFAYVERNWQEVKRTGYIRSPITGRLRWLGWFPKITEVANFPVQSLVADAVNTNMIELAPQIPGRLIAQVHDSCVYEVELGKVEEGKAAILAQWARPFTLPNGNQLAFRPEIKVARRYSEL